MNNTRKNIQKNTKNIRKNNTNKNSKSLRTVKELNPNAKEFTPSALSSAPKVANINALLAKELNKLNVSANKNQVTKPVNKKDVETVLKELHLPSMNPLDYIAIDCEMVGVAPRNQSALAEVSLVDFNGKTIYHEYVKPNKEVIDYRTFVSGITPEILEKKGKPFWLVQQALIRLLHNKILVGHGLQNDINAIGIAIPKEKRWDTTEIPMFMRKPNWGGPLQPKKLKVLVKNFVGKNIQTGEHSATEDAEASMDLFKWYLMNVVMKELVKAQ